jgi:nitroimidazol reductase NimA-like FMN-containing flavoprotein (pyridoxamine 5'-phosphate oxidase superfamily)
MNANDMKGWNRQMFRTMQRQRQRLSETKIKEILVSASSGVLACQGDDGYPYAVPLSFVYVENAADRIIYFHCAKSGHKLDALRHDQRVSFAIVDRDDIVSEEFTSYFRSVIAFGHAREVNGTERSAALLALCEKYCGDQPRDVIKAEVAECRHALVIAIDIKHLSGKEARELAKATPTACF